MTGAQLLKLTQISTLNKSKLKVPIKPAKTNPIKEISQQCPWHEGGVVSPINGYNGDGNPWGTQSET